MSRRLIIAGSRTITEHVIVASEVAAFIGKHWKPEEIVSGTARGVDRIGEILAEGWEVPVKRMPADWDVYGKKAGMVRNYHMAEYADGLCAVWDGKSRGTANMIAWAAALELDIHVRQWKV